MNINLYVTNENQPHKFDSSLGISYLNIAVSDAPYRTGNLRSAIKLQHNGPKVKRIIYQDSDAYYLNYLEEGRGRNKMHKGFIENDTVNDILTETASFLLTGVSSFTRLPTITFRTDRARNYERTIMARNNISLNKRLTANDRATLSRAYVREHGLNTGKNYYSKNNISATQPQITSTINNKIHFGWGQLRGK